MLYNGGIGSLADMKYILNETHFSGVVCGAYFVLNGKLRSPLISYLNEEEMASPYLIKYLDNGIHNLQRV